MKNPKDQSEQKFETVMENLQTIVEEMESGDLPLDNLISRYEEGMKLVKLSRHKLAQAEQKIEVLTKTPDKSVISESPLPSPGEARSPQGDDVGLF